MAAIVLDAEDKFAKGGYPLGRRGGNRCRLFDWLDHWVLVRPANDGSCGQIMFLPKRERHVETNE